MKTAFFTWQRLCTGCLPRAGVLPAIHCSQSLRAPFPSPLKGLHRTRERAGERGGARRCLPRGAGAAAGGGGGGGAEAGSRPRAPRSRPRDSPAGPARGARADLPAPRYPQPPRADLSLLPNGSPREHTPSLVNSPRSPPPCPPPLA